VRATAAAVGLSALLLASATAFAARSPQLAQPRRQVWLVAAVGTAVIGTIFASGLRSRLRQAFPHAPASAIHATNISTSMLAKLTTTARATYLNAFAGALNEAFLVAAFVAVAGFICSLFIRQLPMRTTIADPQDPANSLGSSRSNLDV
jgi:hypothetical protein